MASKYIHMDNNGTTHLCKTASKMVAEYKDAGNPSATSKWGQKSKKMIEGAQAFLHKWLGTGPGSYEIIWTSGATESNCWMLRSIAEASKRIGKNKPHIIISSIEHKSMLACAESLRAMGVEISHARPTIRGVVEPEEVKRLIKPNTILISIMSANNETGAINPVSKIGKLAHDNKIPFHTDATQLFPKERMAPSRNNIDAMSISFHKLHALKGIGALIIKKKFLQGYGLESMIAGSQQGGLRGGTENVCGIASAFGAMKEIFTDRKKKTKNQQDLIDHFLSSLEKKFPRIDYGEIVLADGWAPLPTDGAKWTLLGPESKKNRLSNTALIAIITPNKFCNKKLKEFLCSQYIDVSIGSACNTSDPKASHVLTAIGSPPIVRRGTLRISISDYTTKTEINKLISSLVQGIKKQSS